MLNPLNVLVTLLHFTVHSARLSIAVGRGDSLEENTLPAAFSVIDNCRYLFRGRIGFNDFELALYAVAVPLTILLFDSLVLPKCLDKLSMDKCNSVLPNFGIISG